ncbi:MAG TPA: SpoIID/LytB domain-containing protein [Solirubrobacteraceae bacterium]
MRAAVGLCMAASLALAGPALAAPAPAKHSHAAAPGGPATTLHISGGGYGHGIGMSQYGAYGYALHGWTYQQILSHYYTGTALGTTNPAQTVRVLLGSGSAAFAGATGAGGKRLNPSLTYDVVPLANGSLKLVNQSTRRAVGTFTAPLTAVGPGPLSLAGLGSYRGALEFRPNGSGGVYTVNAIGLDDYVQGVIAAEMPSTWSPEALKAQAVAARTYAITTDVAGGFYNLYPDTRSQMYKGVAAETAATDAAVAATAGQIVTYNGAPAVTYFFASSGGYTENVEDAWPGATADPWLRGVPDPYDGAGGDPYHHWTRQLTLTAAAKQLGKLVKGKLIGIRVTRHGASPRIMSASVIGTRGTTTVTGSQLEGTFGLLSTWAQFTTISAASSPTPAPGSGGAKGDLAVIAQMKRVFGQLANASQTLHGTIFPAGRGALATVEVRTGKHWHRSGTMRLGSGGRYAVRLAVAGVYRVVYRGLAGPSVEVH